MLDKMNAPAKLWEDKLENETLTFKRVVTTAIIDSVNTGTSLSPLTQKMNK